MELKKKIRVLVVDDSILFREVIARGIASDRNIEVVATANDPFDARDKIMQYEPDVMTCDVEMPKMNGIDFIRRLLPQYKIPVIVVSTLSETVFDALDAGAVDFVIKPDIASVNSVENFIYEMIGKIKIASVSKIHRNLTKGVLSPELAHEKVNLDQVIAIGSSTGGTEALAILLKALPPDMPGILAVQHIPPVFSKMFAERLNTTTNLRVREAREGDYVERGLVLIAPGDRHMKIKKIGERYKIECFFGEKVNGHCPSVDVLFESVAREAGKNATGIILTGMGHDGAKGLLSIRKAGGLTIGQDEKTCVVYGMPKVAYNIGAVMKQAPLEEIASLL